MEVLKFVANPYNRANDEYGLNYWKEGYHNRASHDNDIVLVAEMVAKLVYVLSVCVIVSFSGIFPYLYGPDPLGEYLSKQNRDFFYEEEGCKEVGGMICGIILIFHSRPRLRRQYSLT